VVDTPPAAHARDLLDSPKRMHDFLNGRSLRWFLRPSMKASRFGLKAIGGAGGALISMLSKITGAELLKDTVEFFEAFEGMYDTFTERIAIVERMFSDEKTGFLVVTSPEREGIDDAEGLWQLVVDRDYTFVGSVVNRVEPEAATSSLTRESLEQSAGIEHDLASRICAAARDHELLARRDAKRTDALADATGGAPTITVPRIDDLGADLDGIGRIAELVLQPH
jgi:anion-transporting  ArsA/GET3 family ATPase